MRQNCFFQPDNKNNRELQAFGGMQRHQCHRITIKVMRVEVADQADFF